MGWCPSLMESAGWLSWSRFSRPRLRRSKALIRHLSHRCWGQSAHLYPDTTSGTARQFSWGRSARGQRSLWGSTVMRILFKLFCGVLLCTEVRLWCLWMRNRRKIVPFYSLCTATGVVIVIDYLISNYMYFSSCLNLCSLELGFLVYFPCVIQ